MIKLLTRTAIQIALFITLPTYILARLFTTGHTVIGVLAAIAAIAAIPLFAHAFHSLGRDWNNWRMNRANRVGGRR